MSGADAVVIGAGCAGLATATALADAGARVVVVEARPVLGGRTFATRDAASGDLVDNGQHVLFGCYRESFGYLDRIGARDAVLVQSGLAVPMVDRQGQTGELRCPALPSPWQLLAGVLGWSALSWRDRLSVLGMARALDRPPADVARLTVTEWLRAAGQSPRLVEMLWEPLALAALNQPPSRALAPTFAEVLRRMLGSGPDDAALVIPARSLTDTLVAPAVRYLESRGGRVVAGAPARVLHDARAVRGVAVRGEELRADVVISTVPWHALASLFDVPPGAIAPLLAIAARMRSAPIVTVNLWFDRVVLPSLLLGLPGRTFQWAFDKGLATPGVASHVSMVCSGADEVVGWDNDALTGHAHRELTAAVPEARRARLVRATAVRERRATFSLEAGEPSRPGTRTPLDGFFLAGDWTDTGLPATIESAILSGHRAAAEVPLGRR